MNIKEELFALCFQNINKRIQTIEKRLNAMVEARNSETKCVVGDKHETGRTMMHLEEEKSRMQYFEVGKVRQELLKIDINKKYNKVESGSLVFTSNGDYFISIGVGKVELNNKIYFCISPFSPIGINLIGKTKGESIIFNSIDIQINDIY
jgi:transcription elongation GreA/GreB family factor